MLSACQIEEVNVPEETRYYIALGDSVSAGYGIYSQSDRHTDVFFHMLMEDGIVNEYINMSVSGFTTSDLLHFLNNMNTNNLSHFQNAAVITLNIGGNNILQPFLKYMPDTNDLGRILSEAIYVMTELRDIFDEIMEFVDNSRETVSEIQEFASEVHDFADNFSILDIFRFRDIMNEASLVIGDTVQMFDAVAVWEVRLTELNERVTNLEIFTLLSFLTEPIPPELETELLYGVKVFSDDFSKIISWLETNAPNAKIIVNTVYNPIPENLFGLPIALYEQSNILVQSINKKIYEINQNERYIISDVHSILSNDLSLMNFNLDFIHPNPTGHNLIAQLNYDNLQQHR